MLNREYDGNRHDSAYRNYLIFPSVLTGNTGTAVAGNRQYSDRYSTRNTGTIAETGTTPYTAINYYSMFPPVPSGNTDTLAGNRHHPTGTRAIDVQPGILAL